jgi:hypothetical protein
MRRTALAVGMPKSPEEFDFDAVRALDALRAFEVARVAVVARRGDVLATTFFAARRDFDLFFGLAFFADFRFVAARLAGARRPFFAPALRRDACFLAIRKLLCPRAH